MPSAGSLMDNRLVQNISGLGAGTLFSTGFSAMMGVNEYKNARERGASKLGATTKAVGEAVIADVVGFKTYMGLQLAGGAPKMAVKAYSSLDQKARSMSRINRNNPFANSNFNDTQQAFTMRQAGMQLAKASKHNLQHAMLGNEAQYMHL